MSDADLSDEIRDRVRAAAERGTPLAPRGGGSKSFLGRSVQAETLSVAGHRGIVRYEPSELFVTARAGTTLDALDEALAERGQMLAFEPPRLGDGATLGGTIAAGLSGPRRPYAGAARDFVLGTRVVNGRAEELRFGGEVMKNVAGYDVSRLMTGAHGTLGVLLDVSLKVLPRPAHERTLVFEHSPADAVRTMNEWAGRPLPLSAACHYGGCTRVRLSGTENGVATAASRLGGETLDDAGDFWRELRELRAGELETGPALWRVSVPSTAPPLALPGQCVIDWGGALRWLSTDADAGAVRSVAASLGGHASCYRGAAGGDEVFQPLSAGLLRLHRRIKAAFDPHGVLNPGRMYADV